MIKLRQAANATKSLTTSSQQLAAANEFRKRLIITNGSDVAIWVSFGATAAIGTGLYLAAAGGTLEIPPDELYTGAVNGIAASGSSKVVGVVEFS